VYRTEIGCLDSKHGNETSYLIKGGEVLDHLNYYQLLKKICSMELVTWFVVMVHVPERRKAVEKTFGSSQINDQ
jgi:hypothetical protein